MTEYEIRRRFRDRKRTANDFDRRLRRRARQQHRQVTPPPSRAPSVQQGATVAHASLQPTLAQIADVERLIAIHKLHQREAGQAPGPDRITYRDLGPREVARIYRAVSKEILAGTYEPSQALQVQRPKPAGGFRTLSLRSIVHRTVSAALTMALGPYWETVLLPCCYARHPGRGVWRLLVDLEHIVATEQRFVLQLDDIAQAFDHVPIDRVMEKELSLDTIACCSSHGLERETILG